MVPPWLRTPPDSPFSMDMIWNHMEFSHIYLTIFSEAMAVTTSVDVIWASDACILGWPRWYSIVFGTQMAHRSYWCLIIYAHLRLKCQFRCPINALSALELLNLSCNFWDLISLDPKKVDSLTHPKYWLMEIHLMWVEQCHNPSPSHHHRCYIYHSQKSVVYGIVLPTLFIDILQ